MRILILNGPNLNTLGQREPSLYGTTPFEEFLIGLRNTYPTHEFFYFQSNHEGALIDRLQAATEDAVIINAGALSHTSYALYDALRATILQAVEVHLTNIFAREPFRAHSVLSPACVGVITGLGLMGYGLAVQWLLANAKAIPAHG